MVMGCESSQVRNAACKSLLDYGFANFAVISPELTEAEPVPVKLGKSNTVDCRLGDTDSLLIDKAQKNAITTELSMEPSVTAPVSQGQRLGTLTIRSGEQILREVPLVAAENVERLTWGDLFGMVLGRAAMAKT